MFGIFLPVDRDVSLAILACFGGRWEEEGGRVWRVGWGRGDAVMEEIPIKEERCVRIR